MFGTTGHQGRKEICREAGSFGKGKEAVRVIVIDLHDVKRDYIGQVRRDVVEIVYKR